MNLQSVIKRKGIFQADLLGLENVVACGVGYKEVGSEVTDELCVVVSVTKKLPDARLSPGNIVPKELGGAHTDVQEVGVIRALIAREEYQAALLQRLLGPVQTTDRRRPAPGGVSVGHIDITAGTLGCLVQRDGEQFILSNNHVLANTNAGRKGDPIIQPGRHDGGTLNDQIATLEDFVPIDFGTEPASCPIASAVERLTNWAARLLGSKYRVAAFQQTLATNYVDAAIARPLAPACVTDSILEIGVPKGAGKATLGTPVRKSGRTTGFTTGKIIQVHATVQVNYGNGKVALFEEQLMAGAMSAGGDSGSVVLDEDDYVVGLLFAGSDATTIINPIHFVLDALDVQIAGG